MKSHSENVRVLKDFDLAVVMPCHVVQDGFHQCCESARFIYSGSYSTTVQLVRVPDPNPGKSSESNMVRIRLLFLKSILGNCAQTTLKGASPSLNIGKIRISIA